MPTLGIDLTEEILELERERNAVILAAGVPRVSTVPNNFSCIKARR